MENSFIDERIILEKGDRLKAPGNLYIIDTCIGRGSNAIVYLGHYEDHQLKDLFHRILIKELYPFDEEGRIRRNADGDICVDPSAEEFYAMHRESYRRGNIFHAAILNDHPGELDFFIDTFSDHNTLYSVLEFTGGRNVLQEMRGEAALTLTRVTTWMKELLGILKVFHDEGYLHLDISLDNILLTGQGEKERLTLIDYNSSISLDEVHGDNRIVLSTKQGYEYAAPEVLRADRKKIGFGTDLYSVTAVFFRLLFGRGRTTMERVNRFTMPEMTESCLLYGQYPIVIDLVNSILTRGFQTNPRLRYQSADQMLGDIRELEERIRCHGITQWALWQKGKERAANIIRRNTALHYLMDPEKIYPLKAQASQISQTEDWQTREIVLSDDSYLKEMTGKRPVLLLGSGGMGKTTAMLRLAFGDSSRYTERSMAVVYISLFDWKNGDKTYIQDKILEYMDYDQDLQENARKELRNLLSQPIHTKNGDKSRLLLCLDGLNEASGDVNPLLDEI